MPSNTTIHTTRWQQWIRDHSYLRVSWRFKLIYTLQGKNLTDTSYVWPHESHVWQPSAKSLLSQTWIPAPEMKSCPSAIVWPGRHPGLPHSPSNKAPWSSEVWFGKVVTGLLDLPAHIKPGMRSVQVKTCHQDQNNAVLNRHRWGLPPWNLEIATALSPLFPSESSTFVYLPHPVTSTIHEHKHSLYSCNHNSF
jgi:hypothetical protein